MNGPVMHRVKLYKLDAEGNWVDHGTGLIAMEVLQTERPQVMGLIIVQEGGDPEQPKTLLVHKLSREDIYQRQGGKTDATIISWTDREVGSDIAVSFEKVEGCDFIWSQIKQVQEAVNKDLRGDDDLPGVVDYPFVDDFGMPAPEIANLEEIAKAVCTAPPQQRERVAGAMLRPGWINQLLDVFKQCEDLEDGVSLGHIFRIVRGAIMLNDPQLLEELLKEEFVMDVVGALEQDPELGTPQKHRQFLSSSVVFKEVVPITDPTLLAKIHQTYRIQYIKDVILPRSLDDSAYATLSSLALFNNVEVVSALAADPDFLAQLFRALQSANPGSDEWSDLVSFLQEFCNLARHLQQNARTQLFNKLVQLGLFDQVTRIMELGSEATKLKATDVLISVSNHDTQALRDFLYRQPDVALLSLLVREFTEGSGDGGLCEQVLDLLQRLLDPETLKEKPEKSEFVELFYDKFMNRMVDVITSDKAVNPKEGTHHVPASTLSLIVEFMCFCVLNHTYRMKYYAMRNNTLSKVLWVIRRPERWLACAAIRFIRTCLGTKDNFYTRQLVKGNLLDPVMSAFFQNGDRYNLLNSAVIELVDFAIAGGLKEVVEHLVEQFGSRLDEIDYVDTFKKLRVRYEQHKDAEAEQQQQGAGPPGPADSLGDGKGGPPPLRGRTFAFDSNGEPAGTRVRGGQAGGPRGQWEDRVLSRDEEDYFETDEDDSGGTPGTLDTDFGPLPPLEGPFPRPRRPQPDEDTSPPSSPKRGLPASFNPGPHPKRQAGPQRHSGSGGLSIFTSSTFEGGGGQGGPAAGPQAHQGAEEQGGGEQGAASPAQGWLSGLAAYDDEDDESPKQQQQDKALGSAAAGAGGDLGRRPDREGDGGSSRDMSATDPRDTAR